MWNPGSLHLQSTSAPLLSSFSSISNEICFSRHKLWKAIMYHTQTWNEVFVGSLNSAFCTHLEVTVLLNVVVENQQVKVDKDFNYYYLIIWENLYLTIIHLIEYYSLFTIPSTNDFRACHSFKLILQMLKTLNL